MNLILFVNVSIGEAEVQLVGLKGYFEHLGITNFADYRYYPNQFIFNKMLDALKKQEAK